MSVRELEEQTGVGDLLIRCLMRAQLWLALRLAATVAVLLGGLPLLFALVPRAGELRLFGLALPWLLLGIVAYPLLIAAGALYVRQAGRNEREFSELVDRS